MEMRDIDRMCQACAQCFDLKNLKLSDSYSYASLPLCVIDAVYSIGVRYMSTKNVVDNYCTYFDLDKYTTGNRMGAGQHNISQLVANIEMIGAERAADRIFRNHQRTSTRNGILKVKAEAVLRFAKVLQKYGIETFHDLRYESLTTGLEKEIQAIPGQKSGLSFHYFCMLAGDDSQAKPDRHVLRYLKEYTGKNYSISEAQELLTKTAERLQGAYPHLSVRLLDHTIWNYMAHGHPQKKEKNYNKLVRDRIPESVKAGGKQCEIEILGDAEYLHMIDAKLDEVLAEYHEEQSLEKLADLLEVLYAAASARGHTLEELECARTAKFAKYGGYTKKILLKKIAEK